MRRTVTRWLGRVGLPMLAATAVLSGQTQTPQNQNQTTFRGRADYVSTDVIVKDSRGQFVPDLRPSDFEVLEDGVPQTIEHFRPIIGGRAMGDLAPTATEPVAREGLILPKSRARNDVSGRIFIIFIDDMHLQPSDSIRARKVLEQIRDEVIHDNDLIGLVSTGFSSISTDLTYDFNRRRFNEAINKLMGSADTPQEILAMPESSEGISKLRYNANVAFRTAYDILGQAAQITDRRKSFIYVSSGYSFNPFKDSRYKQAKEQYEWMTADGSTEPDPDSGVVSPPVQSRWENPFESSGQQFAEGDLVAQIAELTRAARRANVVFYAVDPRGLDAGPTLNNSLSVGEWREWITTTISSLQILSEETGGFAIVNTNDFRRGLQRIDAETSDYYLIGYSSTNPDPLRVRRVVEIKVPSRPDLVLQYRPEYTLDRANRRR